MRAWLAAAVVALLYLAGRAPAGLYIAGEPDESPQGPLWDGAKAGTMPSERFRREVMSEILSVSNAVSARHKRYLARRDALRAKGRLSDGEQATLGGYLIRLRDPAGAIGLLMPRSRQARPHYAVLANLATAYQLNGQLAEAIDCLEALRDAQWDGLSEAQVAWYRRAEEYHLRLLRQRSREARPAGEVRTVPAERGDDAGSGGWSGGPGRGSRAESEGRGQRGNPPPRGRKEEGFSLQERGGQTSPPRRAGGPPVRVDALFGPQEAPVRFVGTSGQFEPGTIGPNEKAKLPADAAPIVEQLLAWLPEDTRLYWLLGELVNAEGDVQGAATILDDCVWVRGYTAPELKEHRRILNEAKKTIAPAAMDAPAKPAPPSWLPSRGRIIAVGVLLAAVIVALIVFQVRELRRRRAERRR